MSYSREQKEALGRLILEGLQKGDAEMIEGCLKRGADPDVSVQGPEGGPARPLLHWASKHFSEKCARTLLDHGAGIEVRDGEGETPIFFAIRCSNAAAVEFLMKNGADPVAQNAKGTCASDVARGLRTDYDSYAKTRDKILKALACGFSPAGDKPVPQAAKDFESAAAEIPVLKPIELQRKKNSGGAGFNL